MSDQPAPPWTNPVLRGIGRGIDAVVLNSRWLLAPFYLGLVVALAVLFLLLAISDCWTADKEG